MPTILPEPLRQAWIMLHKPLWTPSCPAPSHPPTQAPHIQLLPAPPHPHLLLGRERSLTFRGRQDDLAEGPAAQLVLSQDTELVLGVGLQPWHKEVSGPHGHRQGQPVVVGSVRTLGPRT